MPRDLTLEMKLKIAALQEECGSVTVTRRRFNAIYGINTAPTRPTIYSIHKRFLETGSVADRKRTGRPRHECSEEKIAAIKEACTPNQGKSIRSVAAELNVSRSTIYRILHRDLRFQDVRMFQDEDLMLPVLKKDEESKSSEQDEDPKLFEHTEDKDLKLLEQVGQECVKKWLKHFEKVRDHMEVAPRKLRPVGISYIGTNSY